MNDIDNMFIKKISEIVTFSVKKPKFLSKKPNSKFGMGIYCTYRIEAKAIIIPFTHFRGYLQKNLFF